jgi:predicted nucleic acid-binding protein
MTSGLSGDDVAEDTPQPPSDVDLEIADARAQIEQTRAEMSDTIDAIQEKLSPENLAEQAKDAVTQATVGKVEQAVTAAESKVAETATTASETITGAGSSAAQSIRHHPLPLALTGVAVAGILIGARLIQARKERQAQASRFAAATRILTQVQERTGRVAEQVRRRGGEKATESPEGRAAKMREKARQARDQAASRARRRKAEATNPEMQPQAQQSKVPALVQDMPVAVVDLLAALAVMVGLAILRRARRSD